MSPLASPIIELRHVHFAYGSEMVLEDISFTVHPGEYVAVVGPNGGGKSTLAKLILGILSPLQGTVLVGGTDPRQHVFPIGYVPQHATYQTHFPITVLETVLMGLPRGRRRIPGYRKEERDRALATLEQVGLQDCASARLDSLSGGQKQRAMVARVLMSDPPLLLFDEPTANVDPHGKFCLFDIFANLTPQRTVVIISHDLIATGSAATSVAVVNRRLIQRSHMDDAMLALMYGQHGTSCPLFRSLHNLHTFTTPRS
jgi:zinc transport system ATP-binding protein